MIDFEKREKHLARYKTVATLYKLREEMRGRSKYQPLEAQGKTKTRYQPQKVVKNTKIGLFY